MKLLNASHITAGRLALLLWLITLVAAGWLFFFGQTAGSATDGRTLIRLQPAERNLVLMEMRGLLAATQGIIAGLGKHDLEQVSQAAQAAGMRAAADVNPALMAKLPLSFKSLGMSVHRDMDEIARAAAAGEPEPQLMMRLSGTLAKCVACHAEWQLEAPGIAAGQ